MKTFREYLRETEQHSANSESSKSDTSGTYASLKLDEESKTQLSKWLTDNVKIANSVSPDEYHCTVVYSKIPVPEVANINPKLPIKASMVRWEIFGIGEEKMLVLVIAGAGLQKLFKQTRKLGATWDFDNYTPHITVATNYTETTVPEIIPQFSLLLNKFVCESLIER